MVDTIRTCRFYMPTGGAAHDSELVSISDGKLGLLGFAALIIAIIGVWKFAVSTFAASHPDNSVAQAAIHFW
jgi:hypothetical protein